MTEKEVRAQAEADILESRNLIHHMMEEGFIKKPPLSMIQECVEFTVAKLKNRKK